MRINDALAEALDAIGDDPDYAEARRHLDDANRLLDEGATAEVQAALDRGIAAMNAACPI